MNNLQYLPLSEISKQISIPYSTLKIKVHLAARRGIALPTRRRIGKTFFYDCIEFNNWLFANADALRQTAPNFEKK